MRKINFYKKLIKKRKTIFTNKTCQCCGSPEATGGHLYPFGYENKLYNWGYFCKSHWSQIRQLLSSERNLYKKAEKYDYCLCCDLKEEHQILQNRRNDLLKNISFEFEKQKEYF